MVTEATPHNVYSGGSGEPMSSAYSSSGQNLYVAAPVRGGPGGDARRGQPHDAHDQPPRPPPPRNDGTLTVVALPRGG